MPACIANQRGHVIDNLSGDEQHRRELGIQLAHSDGGDRFGLSDDAFASDDASDMQRRRSRRSLRPKTVLAEATDQFTGDLHGADLRRCSCARASICRYEVLTQTLLDRFAYVRVFEAIGGVLESVVKVTTLRTAIVKASLRP